jgi:hypothetical protein
MIKKVAVLFLTSVFALQAATISTSKESYGIGEQINVYVASMTGRNQDWVGLYPQNASNAWENVVSWAWTNDVASGNISLNGIETAGSYQARAFYNNSYTLQASDNFTVQAGQNNTTVSTMQNEYDAGESITVHVEGMAGNWKDWVGVYSAGSSNDWGNVLSWKYTEGITSGNIVLNGIASSGDYQVRAFFNDSFTLEATGDFSIRVVNLPPTVYENANNGYNPNWVRGQGDYDPYTVDNVLVLTPYWVNSTTNTSYFYLPVNNPNQRVLEMDIGGLPDHKIATVSRAGYMPHFSIGAYVTTTQGRRAMMWDSFFNHGDVNPFKEVYGSSVWLYYPSPVEHVRGWYAPKTQWDHFRVDMEQQLQILEPGNHVLSVDTLFFTGGFLDNIKLSSQ